MKRQATFLAMSLSAAALLVSGCNEPKPAAAPPNNTPVVVQTVETIDTVGDASNPPAPPLPPGANENTNSTVAQVGFGKKGHYGSSDYISVTVGARFRAEESITLSRITNALQQYKAINSAYPKTHEIFMEEVIDANSIHLPELRAGEEYLYDPELAAQTDGKDSLRIVSPKN